MQNKPTLQRIIGGGYCIGCGVCCFMAANRISMKFDQYGMLQPVLSDEGLDEDTQRNLLKVCPFSNDGMHEDPLAQQMFQGVRQDARIGRYAGLYVGHVAEGAFRGRGSSGGLVSWILAELLQRGEVDGVLHVGSPTERNDSVYTYRISTSVEEVLEGAKSKYYPVELSEVLAHVRSTEGRYALVGVPCFVKAVRRLAHQDPVVRERIVFYVGLVCGHLKSKAFADCIAWQAGIEPGRLEEVDFRVKLPQRAASEYGIRVKGDGIDKTAPVSSYFGSNWGYGFFKYGACEYCDDVFAETADVAVGDAWLPEYVSDGEGNSVVVTRSPRAESLLREAREAGRLCLRDCSADDMAASQAGGLRHRRDGLACRLSLKEATGEWAPAKRVAPSPEGVSPRRRKIYLLREELRTQSHQRWLESVEAGTFSVFKSPMERLIRRYDRMYASFPLRVLRRTCRAFLRIVDR